MTNKSNNGESDEALRRAVSRLLVPIQTSGELDEEAFSSLHEEALKLVRRLRGEKLVPKALLMELLAVYTVLRSEAPHFGEKRDLLLAMADKIEICFRLILADEVPEDRQAGVPRIV